jgi:hypothetical protein
MKLKAYNSGAKMERDIKEMSEGSKIPDWKYKRRLTEIVVKEPSFERIER